MRQTFAKEERLKSKKMIEELMKAGHSITAEPLRLIWQETRIQQGKIMLATVAVSKRNFKNAVDRNKLKRRMREAYRKNKYILYKQLELNKKNIRLMFFHVSKQMSGYPEIESGMINVMEKLAVAL